MWKGCAIQMSIERRLLKRSKWHVVNQSYGAVEIGAQERCESRRGRPVLPVPNSPDGLYGRETH